jgi:hypothetical protein
VAKRLFFEERFFFVLACSFPVGFGAGNYEQE